MHLSGGSWIYSASLRYIFTLPMMALMVWKQGGFAKIHTAIKKEFPAWFLWSIVGFGLFYAPLSFAGDHGESWLIAASWQVTIVMGIFLTPLFGKKVPIKNLLVSMIILCGVGMVQFQQADHFQYDKLAVTLIPILIAAISYPLGNRKIMILCKEEITTTERIYGMTLCSLPLWILLAIAGVFTVGVPSGEQVLQSFLVALFSGVLATMFFFRATDLVKHDQKKLAVVESTQSGEVIFTLLGSILLLGDALPNTVGWIGLILIVGGMIFNSLISGN